MKPRLKNILYGGLAIACIAFNLQHVFMHSVSASAAPLQASTAKIMAPSQTFASDILQVVNVAVPVIIAPATIQAAVQPETINILALQSAASNLLFSESAPAAFAVQSVAPTFSLNASRIAGKASAIQSPTIAEASSQQAAGLPASPPYYMSGEKDRGIIVVRVETNALAISQESKGFTAPDMSVLLRC